MSTLGRRFLFTSIALSLFLGQAARSRSAQEDPSRAVPISAAPVPAEKEQYLLLTDDRLIQGIVSRQNAFYVVRKPLGDIRFHQRSVEGSFDSILGAYRYKLDRLPERDPG